MLSPPFMIVIAATWRTPTAVGCPCSSIVPRRKSFPIPMARGATPSRPTCAGEIASAAKAAARLIATRLPIPRIWPAKMLRREKLRSEKKPTRRNRSSIFVDTKAPVERRANDKKFTLAPASCERRTGPASRTVRSGRARAHGGEQPLQGRRHMVAQHRHPPIALGRHPVELDDPALASERLVPVPGIVGPLEGEQRSLDRGHLHDHVVEVIGRFEEAQAAAGILPGRVHIDENRNDLALRIGMNAPVLLAALAPDRRR